VYDHPDVSQPLKQLQTANFIQDFIAQELETELGKDPSLKSANTRRGYLSDLKAFNKWLAGRPAGRLLVQEYTAELQRQGRAPNTINRMLAAVRWYARRSIEITQEQPAYSEEAKSKRAEYMASAERMAIVKDVRGWREPKGRDISQSELKALLAACEEDHNKAGARDAALIALAFCTGLRRAELGRLSIHDYRPSNTSEGSLIVRGKGDKDREIYLNDGALPALLDWLKIRGDQVGPVFCVIRKDNTVLADHGLSGEALRRILNKRINEADIDLLTWHDFRRSFAGALLDNGIDLVTVQKLMGHSSPVTTVGYDRRGNETRRKAIRTLHVPYRSRSAKWASDSIGEGCQ
jgi:site-specific recombinase XerD